MAEFVLNNVQVILGSFDYSSYSNQLDMNYGAELVDVTTFNDGARSRLPSFENFEATLNGFLDTSALVDTEIESRHGETAEAMSVCFGTGAVDQNAYLSSGIVGTYNFGGGVGEPGVYSLELANQGTGAKLVSGYVVGSGNKTASGDEGTGSQAGAIDNTTLGQVGYAALHVTQWTSLTSIDVKIVSDDNSGFTTATDRFTFTQLTDVGSQFMTLASDVTDDYWRAEYTIVGSGNLDVFVTFGIK
jgi:hypothetical protein